VPNNVHGPSLAFVKLSNNFIYFAGFLLLICLLYLFSLFCVPFCVFLLLFVVLMLFCWLYYCSLCYWAYKLITTYWINTNYFFKYSYIDSLQEENILCQKSAHLCHRNKRLVAKLLQPATLFN